jgi:hypothetical protein
MLCRSPGALTGADRIEIFRRPSMTLTIDLCNQLIANPRDHNIRLQFCNDARASPLRMPAAHNINVMTHD